VKSETAIRWATTLLLGSLLTMPSHAFGSDALGFDKKDKPKPVASQVVDSGSFGVFIRGQRVVTETFKVEQINGESIIKSQLKETTGDNPASQKSDLAMTANGELLHYEWSQAAGGSLTVMPNNEFLMEKISTSPNGKAAEQPFLMPNTSVILDNNFFIQREVLIWRYLAAYCKSEGGSWKCQQGGGEFGALVPQDRTSMRVKIEVVGKEKTTIRGAERDLLRLNLISENFEWALWVDDKDQFKLMKVAIPADNTEVIRD
jgi:hypothetical protein